MRASEIWRSFSIRAVSMASRLSKVACSASFSRSERSRASSRALLGAAELDLAFLLQPGLFGLALDIQRLLFRLQVARADLDHRVLLDVVAQLAAGLDRLDHGGQTFGIEPVGGVEVLDVGLVDIGDGHGFQLQPVLVQTPPAPSPSTRAT